MTKVSQNKINKTKQDNKTKSDVFSCDIFKSDVIYFL